MASDDNVIGGTTPAEGNLFQEVRHLRSNPRLRLRQRPRGQLVHRPSVAPSFGYRVWIYWVGQHRRRVWLPGAGNTFTGADGRRCHHVDSGANGNAILGNSIDGTWAATADPVDGLGLGIDLEEATAPPDQLRSASPPTTPGTWTRGRTSSENFPDLTSASAEGGTTTVEGSLSSQANETYRIEFFSSPACDPSGYGEGEVFLGATSETTNGSGLAPFSVELPVSVAPGAVVTATATDEGNNTSEFSACVTVAAASADDDADGVEDSIDVGAGAFDDGSGTSGSITDANGLDVLVSDADDSGDGVKITVSGPSGVEASFTVCGFTIQISGGSEIVVTCGSVTLEVVEGSAEIVLGTGVVVSVPAGGTAKVTDEGGTFYSVENLGPTGITVIVDGTPTVLPAGESSVGLERRHRSDGHLQPRRLPPEPAWGPRVGHRFRRRLGTGREPVSALVGTSSPGSHSVQLTGFDEAGNSTSVSCTYSVGYAFQGFFQPIDNLPTVNSAKAGQTIPVKWRITDYFGVGVANPASFSSITSGSLTCDSSDPQDAIETYAGSSGLQYQGNGNWQFNWKTPKTYAGQCRVMRLNLADGASNRMAEFQFK